MRQKISNKIYLFPFAVGFATLTGIAGEGFVAGLAGITFAGTVLAGFVFSVFFFGAALTGAAFVFLTSTSCPPVKNH
jgi:hypothetical protein